MAFLFHETRPIQKNCFNENCFINGCIISILNLIINDFILLLYILAGLKVLKCFQAFTVPEIHVLVPECMCFILHNENAYHTSVVFENIVINPGPLSSLLANFCLS